MQNRSVHARAVELAESGQLCSVTEIRNALIREGYPYGEIGPLFGLAFKKQLKNMIAAATALPRG